MLLLQLETPKGRYLLDTSNISEIIPLLHYSKVPNGPDYLAGVINFRGRPVPVVDLGLLVDKMPCRQRMNTRIILMRQTLTGKKSLLFGLIAESISNTLSIERNAEEPHELLLHELSSSQEGEQQQFVQLLDLEKILDSEKLASLADFR